MNITNSKRKEELTDVEQQFILRLPNGVAETLRNDITSGTSLKDKLSIELHPDSRKGKLIYEGHLYNAKLINLPCIIETLKTTDKKTFYKTADICQMLVCGSGEEGTVESAAKTQKEKEKEFHSNHGICPPFKNVRKRRFRKTLEKKVQDQPDVEKELRRLLSMDAQAIDVKWQVITDQQPNNNNQILNIGSRDVFGEVSSSSEEGEDSKHIADSSQSLNFAVDESRTSTVFINSNQSIDLPADNAIKGSNKEEYKIDSNTTDS